MNLYNSRHWLVPVHQPPPAPFPIRPFSPDGAPDWRLSTCAATPKIRVSSTKSSIGHLLGGAGSVESVICLLTLRDQFLPASLNVREIDPVVEFDLVQEPREAVVKSATLLRNAAPPGGGTRALLPLSSSAPPTTIAVIGPWADAGNTRG